MHMYLNTDLVYDIGLVEIIFLSPGTMKAIAVNNEILMLNYQIKTFFFKFLYYSIFTSNNFIIYFYKT